MPYHHYLLIPVLLLAGIPLLTTAQNAEGIIPGTLSVKFTSAAADALDISTEDAFVTTGFDSIDRLNAQFGVTEMTRIFRPAGRFEARHRAFGLHRWYRLTIPEGVSVQVAVDAYQVDPNIEIAEPVYEKTFNDGYDLGMEPQIVDAPRGPRTADSQAGIPNDPLFGEQWHYDNTGQTGGTPGADISLPGAHDIQTGDPSVIVSIHDQGVQVDHEDLVANMWVNVGEIPGNDIDDDNNGFVDDVYGYNFADDHGTILPGFHGTHVAGTVAAVTNNGIGVAGVAGGDGTLGSGVRLMSAQVFGATGSGSGYPESYTYAADMGAVISQNSWGYTSPGAYEQAVLDAIDYNIAMAGSEPGAPMDGGLVIFAAGNSAADAEWYPGFYEPIVAVSSTNINDRKSSWSNYGEWVDISGPGGTNSQPFGEEDVLSTLEDGQYGYLAGTSMACPHASGVAALALSQNLGATNAQLRDILEYTTDDIYAVNPNYLGMLGTGRINAWRAVSVEPDTTAPVAVVDLAGTPDGDFVTLTWTSPEDQGFGVQRYDVRYAASPILTETDWENATVVLAAESVEPQAPGDTEELVITSLDFETTYHFGVRTSDGPHVSDLSNSEEVTTLGSPLANVPTDPIEVALPAEAEETRGYTITNAGPSTLSYTIDFQDSAGSLERTPMPKPDPSERRDAPPRDGAEEDSPEPAPAEAGGEPQLMGEGGPDIFGYRWIDSNEPNGPTYSWIDITETGTEVELGLDEHVLVDLPFDFPYYENTFDWVAIQSTGALSFTSENLHYANQEIPTEDAWNGILAGYWDDLNPSEGEGGVYYDTLEDGRFVVSWVEVPHFFNTGSFTFQVVLDANGGILYQYQTVDGGGSHDNSATVGIENLDGTDGLQVVYNAPYVEDGLAVQFSNWLRIDTRSGEIAAGAEQAHTLTFYSGTLAAGEYTTDMIVTTNQSGETFTQEYVVPITLTTQGVGTEDGPAFEGTHRLSAVAPNPIGGLATATLEVAEAQDVMVELFDVRGRKVTTLLESTLAARTAEEIAFDGSDLAPGVYVLRIAGETFFETRRVTVVR